MTKHFGRGRRIPASLEALSVPRKICPAYVMQLESSLVCLHLGVGKSVTELEGHSELDSVPLRHRLAMAIPSEAADTQCAREKKLIELD